MSNRWPARLRGIRWIAGVLAAGVVILVAAWALLVPTADWLATHDVGPVSGPLRTLRLQTARDAARGRLLTLGAGLFAFGALVYTGRNFALSREGQVTDRYTKAIEQLGSGKLDVRIGAVYALERIARDSAADHPTVMEVLAAFIRVHSREQWPLPQPDEAPATEPTTRPDVQAALTVIGRRDVTHDRQPINLYAANLTGANLARANLNGANLARTNFTGAHLIRVNFTGAQLARANLNGANVGGADLTAANLTRADLTGARLIGAQLARANLTDANLAGADLTAADLTGARLIGANLTDALWSQESLCPEGWVRDLGSGRLRGANSGGGGTGN